jgi:hypothetical protein
MTLFESQTLLKLDLFVLYTEERNTETKRDHTLIQKYHTNTLSTAVPGQEDHIHARSYKMSTLSIGSLIPQHQDLALHLNTSEILSTIYTIEVDPGQCQTKFMERLKIMPRKDEHQRRRITGGQQ